MSVTKRGFVVYFNNYPLMATLPYEQQGMLFSALMIYADRVWRDSSVTLEEVMEGFPRLVPEARMACGFMGAAVKRDTEAWLHKQERRAGRSREGQPAAGQRVQEDMERTRRLLEQMRAAE